MLNVRAHLRAIPILFLLFSIAGTPLAFGEVQASFTDTCTLPNPGAVSNNSTISATVGGVASTLTYARNHYYGGLHAIVPTSGTGKFSALTSGNVKYGLLFDSFQLFQSLTSNLQYAVASTNTTCPGSSTYNWLLIRYRTDDLTWSTSPFNQPMDFQSSSQFVGGTMSYNSGTSSFTGVDYFDLESLTDHTSASGDWSAFGFNGFSGATCSSGSFRVQATGTNAPMDQYNTAYFGANSLVLMSAGGNPVVTLGVPQQNLTSGTMSQFSGSVFSGLYTKYSAWLTQDQRTVYMVPNVANFSGPYQFDIYQSSTNLNSGTPDTTVLTSSSQNPTSQTQLGKITCTALNSPSQGFCSGTLDMTASGVTGTGNAVCEFWTASGQLVACTAQYPSNPHIAVSFVVQAPSSAYLAATLSSGGVAQVANAGNSTTLTATLKNLSGRVISSLGNPSDLGQSSALDVATPFVKPTYSGGGSCGTTLGPYASCTLSLGYSPSAEGATIALFRAAYDSGANGIVNATAVVTGTAALSSIEVGPPNIGSSETMTAIAKFSGGGVQDVSSAITWSTNNASAIEISNNFGSANNGTATTGTSGSATITATLGSTSGNRVVSSYNTGIVQYIFGQGVAAAGTYFNGAPYTSAIASPSDIAFDSAGNLYYADAGLNRIQMVPKTTGTFWGQSMTADYVYTIAGDASGLSGNTGNGGIATSAKLNYPVAITFDSSDNLYICDGNNHVQMVAKTSGTIWGQSMTANYLYTVAGDSLGGSGLSGNGGLATDALLWGVAGIAIDGSGNLYISDGYNNRIQMVAKTTATVWGISMTANYIYTIAGSSAGTAGNTGNNGAATSAKLDSPSGITLDSSGNLYIADFNNNRVQFVAKTTASFFGSARTANRIYTIAGSSTGVQGSSGNNGAATSALLSNPTDVAIDSAGSVFISDSNNARIQMVAKTTTTNYGISMTANRIYTIAGDSSGSQGSSGNGGVATSALMFPTMGITFDSSGNLLIADYQNGRIEVVAKTTATFYGQSMTAAFIYRVLGLPYTRGLTSDGVAATSALSDTPGQPAFDSSGNLYIPESGNHRVEFIPKTTGTYWGGTKTAGLVYTIAGSSVGSNGSTGNGGLATSAKLACPSAVAIDSSGNLFIMDQCNMRVQMVPKVSGTYFGQSMTANYMYTIAGVANQTGLTGIGGIATSAKMNWPIGLAVDNAGNIYIADKDNNRILMVPKTTATFFGQSMTASFMYCIAGDCAGGTTGTTGNSGIATSAFLNAPKGVSIDSAGNVIIADTSNNRIQVVPAASGTFYGQSMTANYMYTIAGDSGGSPGSTGNDGPATSAGLLEPNNVGFDASGNLIIADSQNNRIQMVPKLTGTYFGQSMTANYMYTIAGSSTGRGGYFGDGRAATSLLFSFPAGVVGDASGNIFISDQNSLIRELFH